MSIVKSVVAKAFVLSAAFAAVGASAASDPVKADARATGLGGPQIKGLCILNRDEIFVAAKVSQSVNAQYKVSFDAAQTEVNRERDALQADAKNLVAKKAALKAEDYAKAEKELSDRLAKLQAQTNERSQALEATRRNVIERIGNEAKPVIEQVYKQRQCGLLVSREAVLAGNMEMDITAAVIAAMDQKITEMPLAATSESAASVGRNTAH